MSNSLFACTSLAIKDIKGRLYRGRTMEFQTEDPESVIIYYPQNHTHQYNAPDGSKGLSFDVKIPYISISLPMEFANVEKQFYSVDGFNLEGLSYSMNMLPNSALSDIKQSDYDNAIPIVAIGDFILGQYKSITEFREKLYDIAFWTPLLANFNNIDSPFHYAFYDASGDCIVIEITDGVLKVKDNPTLCMTNGPRLEWHFTNLNNYTILTNVDVNQSNLANLELHQPDRGIATFALPSSDTSVDRFVRAAYYTTFYQKHNEPEKQMVELSHIMNKFDRPKLATEDIKEDKSIETEYTVWTALTDPNRGILHIRHYDFINYKTFTFDDFKNETKMKILDIL